MIPFFRLIQIIFRPSGDNILLMLQIKLQHFQKVKHLRLIIHQGQHDNTEGILHLGVLVQQIQDHVGIGVPAQFNNYTGSFPVGFIPQIRNTVYFFLFVKLCDLFDQTGFINHVRKFCYDNTALSVGKCLDIRYGADSYFSASCAVSLFDPHLSQDGCTCGEIRPLDDLKNLFHLGLSVFLYLIINNFNNSADHFS